MNLVNVKIQIFSCINSNTEFSLCKLINSIGTVI